MPRINVQNTVEWVKDKIFIYQPYLMPHQRKNLPDFLIIGAQKSGTTTLRYNLNLHPDIHMATDPRYGEIQFFCREERWKKGVGWYKEHFTENHCLQGEKTPEYLFNYKCHRRMHRIVPQAKLIILLRNPVTRAYSQWNHYNQIYETDSKHWKWKKTDFETALNNQHDVIKRGEYIDQITHLLKYFPKEQIHIGIAEKLRRNPNDELLNIFSFLEVPPKAFTFQNRHTRKYSYPIKEKTRKKLHDHFEPFNDRLFTFLGYSIPEWNA